MSEHLILHLTEADVRDLREDNTINAMTVQGVEVIVHPTDVKEHWDTLLFAESVFLDLEVVGQRNVGVDVTLEWYA